MLTEQFLNSCLSLTLNKNSANRVNKTTFRDIMEILKFYKQKEKNDIPIPIRNKLECLEVICDLKIEDRTTDNILDSISQGEKYKSLIDLLILKIEEEVTDLVIDDNVEQIRIRKKLMSLFYNYDKISEFLDTVKSGSFKSLDDITSKYENFVKTMYTKLMECNRTMTAETSSSLDLVKDDYKSIIDVIKRKVNETSLVRTGFDILDKNILRGGFEKGRLYIFAGGSGSGKSTLLTNFIENGLLEDNSNGKDGVYVYITLENSIDETLTRMYQSIFKISNIAFNENIREMDSNYIKGSIMQKIGQSKRSVIMKYFPKFSISPTDISMVIDDAISEYGPDGIRGVFIDYLDLLKLDSALGKNYDLYRLELSHITSNLKDIAVSYNVPLITASQLTREVYSKNPDAKSLNLSMMSEAIKKVDHADFVALMSKDQTNENIVYMNVGKNRCGASNKCLEFKVDFSFYKFLSAFETGSGSTPNAKSDQTSSFVGIKFDDENNY